MCFFYIYYMLDKVEYNILAQFLYQHIKSMKSLVKMLRAMDA